MAKKTSSVGTSQKKTSVFDIISKFDKSAEVLGESKTAVISDYIDTGSYILNAAISGSLFKGVPAGRCTVLAGDPGTGKSYLALSICRNAQKKGYTPIYMDSESAIDLDFVKRLGCDPDNFIIKQVTTISEVSTFISRTCKTMMEMSEEERPKIIFVLDSLGNLTSDKELNDTIEGNGKRDLTKQQEVKALFRTNATILGRLGYPFVVNSHIYRTQEMFSKTIVTGGSGINFNASVTLLLSTAKLDDRESEKIAEKKVGEFTKTGVIVTAKPEKSRFTIPQKVKFWIPFFKAPNPYIGIEAYLSWENSGIMKGKIISVKDYEKMSDLEKQVCEEMTNEKGEKCYAFPKDTSKNIVVKHLGKEVPAIELFSPEVLTEDLLRKLDETIIRPSFELPSNDRNDDISEFLGGDE